VLRALAPRRRSRPPRATCGSLRPCSNWPASTSGAKHPRNRLAEAHPSPSEAVASNTVHNHVCLLSRSHLARFLFSLYDCIENSTRIDANLPTTTIKVIVARIFLRVEPSSWCTQTPAIVILIIGLPSSVHFHAAFVTIAHNLVCCIARCAYCWHTLSLSACAGNVKQTITSIAIVKVNFELVVITWISSKARLLLPTFFCALIPLLDKYLCYLINTYIVISGHPTECSSPQNNSYDNQHGRAHHFN
jgi:hypothetical protein